MNQTDMNPSSAPSVLVLTGAGISAESGIPTFRGVDGLWEGYRAEDVASPHAFDRDPELLQRFYNMRRSKLLRPEIQPNAAHEALAKFEVTWPGEFFLVTQNIDDLHYRAGSCNVLSMHGELLKARCTRTGEIFDWREDLGLGTPHPEDPDRFGCLRPHVVWFGEMPLGMEEIEAAASKADIFIAIGTSALVFPAAAIVEWTRSECRKIEINLVDTPKSKNFDETIRGKASEEVPRLLEALSNAA